MIHPSSNNQEPTRKALRGADVEDWLNHCAPEGAYIQQAHLATQRPKRTCEELGVCQNRVDRCSGCKPAIQPKPSQPKPHTVWVFGKWDWVAAIVIVAVAYFAVGYFESDKPAPSPETRTHGRN